MKPKKPKGGKAGSSIKDTKTAEEPKSAEEPKKKGRKRLTDEDKAEIARLYEQKIMKSAEIAKRYEISLRTVQRIAKEAQEARA